MNAARPLASAHEMPVRLSTMWVFVMLNMIFADILSFLDPSFLQDVATGSVGGVGISEGFLLVVALVTEVAIAMVVLSRVLRYRANRLANLVAAAVTAAYVIAGGSAAPHYLFFAAIEVVCCGLIAWFAWHWSEPSDPAGSVVATAPLRQPPAVEPAGKRDAARVPLTSPAPRR